MFKFFKAFKNSNYFFIAALLVFALFLNGCDEKYFDSRAEAESYLKQHPDRPQYKIFVRGADGNNKDLEAIHDQEQQQASTQVKKQTNSPVTEGEVLKYEEPAATQSVELFNNGNINGVFNGGKPFSFTLDKTSRIKILNTYHWNDAKGQTPGTISIQGKNGRIYGPWQAVGAPGQGGVPDAYWKTEPNFSLEPGVYTVIDSDPATWSQNEGTGGLGMAWANGYAE